jgi:hypothetical protein
MGNIKVALLARKWPGKFGTGRNRAKRITEE